GSVSPRLWTVPRMKPCASRLSSRKSYPVPLQKGFVPNEVSARSVDVPPRKRGPPESPKHWPAFPCEVVPEVLTNSLSLPLPTLSSLAGPPNRVKNAAGCFLQLGLHGSGLPKCWTPYP